MTIEMTCCECNKKTTLKTKRKDLIEKKKNNTYLCRVCNNTGERNPQYNKKWTDEMRKKRSEMYTGENNPFYGKTHSDETRKILSEKSKITSTGENNPMCGKSIFDYMTPEKIEKWRESQRRDVEKKKANGHYTHMGLISSNSPIKMTRPEKAVREWLNTNGIQHKYGKRVENRQYDFIVGNTLIEVHGDYWHGNPKIYGEGKRPLNETQKWKKDIDIEKENIAKRNGYDLLVIWEYDIKNNDYSILESLKYV